MFSFGHTTDIYWGKHGGGKYGEIADSDKELGEGIGLTYDQQSMGEKILGEQERKNRWYYRDTILIEMVKQVKIGFVSFGRKQGGERIRITRY